MLMEGTGKYFLILFIIFMAVYIAVKLSLANLLKRAKEKSWKGYIPIYTTHVLVKLLNLKSKYFYLSLIPFLNLYYYNIIIKELLKGFNQNPKDSIWYVIFPMYSFPKLVFLKPKFVLNEYDLTEEFVKTENALFKKSNKQEPVIQPVEPNNQIDNFDNQIQYNEDNVESVFTNESLEPDKTHTTYVEAKQEEPKEEKPIITPVVDGRPKLCPKCGARLAPNAEVCFLCGTKL